MTHLITAWFTYKILFPWVKNMFICLLSFEVKSKRLIRTSLALSSSFQYLSCLEYIFQVWGSSSPIWITLKMYMKLVSKSCLSILANQIQCTCACACVFHRFLITQYFFGIFQLFCLIYDKYSLGPTVWSLWTYLYTQLLT